MSIIYTYPQKASPSLDDLIIISDSEDSNETKQIKVSSIIGSGGGGVSGVTSLNNLTGALTLKTSPDIVVTPVGQEFLFTLANTPVNTTYDLSAMSGDGIVYLKLTGSDGSADLVSINGLNDITVARTGNSINIGTTLTQGLTSVGLALDNVLANGLEVTSSPLTANGNITLGIKSGLSPAPTSSEFLDGTGNWSVPSGTSYIAATSTALGLVKLFDNTAVADSAINAASATSNRYYGLQLSNTDKGFVNVPWVNDNTTSLAIKDSGGATQFTSTDSTGLRFSQAGDTSISFDSNTQTVTISSTSTTTDTPVATQTRYGTIKTSAPSTYAFMEKPDVVSGRNYPLRVQDGKNNSEVGQAYVTVPWVDTTTSDLSGLVAGAGIVFTQGFDADKNPTTIVNLRTIGTTSTTSTQTGNLTFTAIDSISTNNYGQTTAYNLKTVTIPGGSTSPWTTSGANIYYAPEGGGNVGINLVNPVHALDLSGNLSVKNGQAFVVPETYGVQVTGTVTLDFNNSNIKELTLGGNTTFQASNLQNGATYIVKITQGSSSYTVTWDSGTFYWPKGTAPVMTAATGKIDIYTFVCCSNKLYGAFTREYS